MAPRLAFTAEDLSSIRQGYIHDGMTLQRLADNYKVSTTTIWQIVHRVGRYTGDDMIMTRIGEYAQKKYDLYGLPVEQWHNVFSSLTNINLQDKPDTIPDDYWLVDGRTPEESMHLAALGNAWAAKKRYHRLPRGYAESLGRAVFFFVVQHHLSKHFLAQLMETSIGMISVWYSTGKYHVVHA